MLTTARYREISNLWANGIEPIANQVKSAMDRFWTPLIAFEARTSQWPHVLRFPRPANDVEAAMQLFAFEYTRVQVSHPVVIEYETPPTPRVSDFRSARLRNRLGHAWRVTKMTLLR